MRIVLTAEDYAALLPPECAERIDGASARSDADGARRDELAAVVSFCSRVAEAGRAKLADIRVLCPKGERRCFWGIYPYGYWGCDEVRAAETICAAQLNGCRILVVHDLNEKGEPFTGVMFGQLL